MEESLQYAYFKQPSRWDIIIYVMQPFFFLAIASFANLLCTSDFWLFGSIFGCLVPNELLYRTGEPYKGLAGAAVSPVLIAS
jgi:hypothetical protein